MFFYIVVAVIGITVTWLANRAVLIVNGNDPLADTISAVYNTAFGTLAVYLSLLLLPEHDFLAMLCVSSLTIVVGPLIAMAAEYLAFLSRE